MSAHKGHKKEGGRAKGTPNRSTQEARDILVQALLNQVDNIKDALNNLKKKDDAKYLDACSKLFTYVLPKKTDITSGDEKIPVSMPSITINSR